MHGGDRYQGNFLIIFASHVFLSMTTARWGTGSAAQVELAGDHAHGLQVSIGVVIDMKNCVDWSISPFAVTSLMQRSPKHCLRIGDRILSIDGQSVTHFTTVKPLYDLLLGPPSSCVRLVVDRVICEDDPVPLSVPRMSVQEHFEARAFNDHEIIFQGWIAKDGRFSSSFKRRWAQLSLFNLYDTATSTKEKAQLGFCFCWGESGPDNFVERSRECFYMPQDSVSATHLAQPLPHGKQLPAFCTEFGFLLKIRGRSMKIFCDSESDREVWMCIFNMASRSSSTLKFAGCDEWNRDPTLKPGSFATCGHFLPPWIFIDEPIERAMERKQTAKVEQQQQAWRESVKRGDELRAEKQKQQEELEQHQKSQMAKACLRRDNKKKKKMQRHIDESFSSNLFHSVDINGLMQAHCQNVDSFEVIATLMQATVGRMQTLERQTALLRAENHAQNAVIDGQTAIIDQLIGQLNQQQPCSTAPSASIAASLKESLAQLHDAALLSHQCFSFSSDKAPAARSSVDDDVSGSSAKSAKAPAQSSAKSAKAPAQSSAESVNAPAARSSVDDDVWRRRAGAGWDGVHFNLFD